jgi:hypothetical protein
LQPELVVMAAGLGSRFGGLKQVEPMGPSGETILDYALYDARRAGIERVVFVIRRELETAFRKGAGTRYESWFEVAFAYQELEALPAGHTVPAGRVKPWGTAHAVLAAREQVRAPFLVINADDCYGPAAFRVLAQWLRPLAPGAGQAYAMVAFRLASTLSRHGSVARGICAVDGDGLLLRVTEHTGLVGQGNGARESRPDGQVLAFTGEEPVSMNIWGLTPALFPELEARFGAFLRETRDPLAEFHLPGVMDALLSEGRATVQVLRSPDPWFGVTYREDAPEVAARLQALVEAGVYPPDLWSPR